MDFKNLYKYFLSILIGLAFISLNIINRCGYAKDLSALSELSKMNNSSSIKNVTVGAEYIYLFSAIRDDWREMFRTSQPGAKIYAGYNWSYVMLELGHSFTTRRAKEFFLNTNGSLFGQNNNSPTFISGKVRYRNTYFDLNLFANLCGDLDLVTSLGLSFIRPHIIINSSNPGSTIGAKLTNVLTKTTFVPRFGVGLRYLVTDSVAIRTMWHFEKNSRIRLRYAPIEFDSNKPFRDANTFSFGVMSNI